MAPGEDSTVIFGCGNIILGDDGFGPAVIQALEAESVLPDNVVLVDAGTGIREYLFDYLLAPQFGPNRLIILDAVDFPDRRPGEVFPIDISSIPAKKIHDFSLHQFPTTNLLLELQEHTGIKIDVLAAQVESIPTQISQGLSSAMRAAVGSACHKILRILSEEQKTLGESL
jgi:coenzyme F420 hydrogenase subunit delta